MTQPNLLAQVASGLGPIGSGPGFGSIPERDPLAALNAILRVVSVIIGFITVCAGIYFLFQLLIGAFGWMTASGDKSRLERAQLRMTHAVIGMVIVVATYALVSIIGGLLGFDILVKDPDALLKALRLNL